MAVTKGPRLAKAEKKQRTRKEPEQAENEETERGAMEGHGGKGCAGEESDTCVDCGKAVLATQHVVVSASGRVVVISL